MISLPLPKGEGNGRRLATDKGRAANRGLVFNKFVDRWSKDSKGVYDLHEAKKDWLCCFSGKDAKAGEASVLRAYCDRLADVAEASIRASSGAGHPDAGERPIEFIAASRFATGLGLAHPVENGFLWHHMLGVPYLPGSSVKGMIRAWASQWRGEDNEVVRRLFGNEGDAPARMGALIVFDAVPSAPVELVTEILTPHDGGWRLKGTDEPKGSLLSPGDWHDPVPVPYLAVEEGAVFRFALGVTRNARNSSDGDPSDVALGYRFLTEALEWVGLGAKTAVGLGRFKTSDAAASEKEAADREARVERQRLAEEESRRIAEAGKAEQKAREQWAPAVGQVIEYRLDGINEIRVISALLPGGDFEARLRDGSRPVVTDKNESSLVARSLEEYGCK